MTIETAGTVKSKEDIGTSSKDRQLYWQTELEASHKSRKNFVKNANKITRRFLDQRSVNEATDVGDGPGDRNNQTRLNVFNANIQIQRAILYGNPPEADVSRRYDDPDDDAARVASEILERTVNADFDRSFEYAAGYALDDRLLVGLGTCRIRYEAKFEEVEVPPVVTTDPFSGESMEMAPGYTEQRKVPGSESCPTDFVQWKDFAWSPCRTWKECRWVGFRSYMTYDQLVERFGKKKAEQVKLNEQKKSEDGQKGERTSGTANSDAWMRGEVWEIWDKDNKKVEWVSVGCDEVLDSKEDPLKLTNFFPCPEPLMANLTSSSFMPRADFVIHQDTYDEIDLISTRITWLERAVKVVGIYDASQPALERMLEEGQDNILIPAQDWSQLSEKGGTEGSIQFLPLQEVVGALQTLRDYRQELIEILYQQTGMSDILRGQGQAGATATEQSIKAKFAGIRMNYQQEQFARFVTQLQRLRAEVILEFFDDQTIIDMSNIMFTPHKELIGPALQVLRDQRANFRIDITGESLAAEDRAAAVNEKSMFMQGLATFISAAQPLAAQFPDSVPMLLEMMKWSLSSFKGARSMESVMDQAISQLQQSGGQQEGPSPEEMETQVKMKELELKNKELDIKGAELQLKQGEQEIKKAELGIKQAEVMRPEAPDNSAQVENLRGRNRIAEINAQSEANIREAWVDHDIHTKESDQDLAEDLIKIEADAEADSRYNPGQTGIESD